MKESLLQVCQWLAERLSEPLQKLPQTIMSRAHASCFKEILADLPGEDRHFNSNTEVAPVLEQINTDDTATAQSKRARTPSFELAGDTMAHGLPPRALAPSRGNLGRKQCCRRHGVGTTRYCFCGWIAAHHATIC